MPKPIPPTPDLIEQLADQIARHRDNQESIETATWMRNCDNELGAIGKHLHDSGVRDRIRFPVPHGLSHHDLALIVIDALTAHLTDANAEIRASLAGFGIDLSDGDSE